MKAGGEPMSAAALAGILIPAITGVVGLGSSIYGMANTPDAPKVKSPQPGVAPMPLTPGAGTQSPFLSRSPLQNAEQRQSVALSMLR